ncbi:hypothetical protein MMC13_005371 [Lambiella insularis]|nr:hypothetical protein [Lambiella insularis]
MALNPEYDMTRSTDYEAHNISASSYRPASNRTEQSRSLVARNRVLPQNCYCPGVNPAPDYETFIAMVDEWNTYDIRLTCGGGPRTCITLLCSANGNGNGVFLCNDNLYSIAPSLIYLLDDYAIPIGNFCGTQNPPHSIIGQMFDTDNYNVIAFPHTASQLEPRDALTPLYELGNNYTVYPIRWTGQVHRGGPNVTLQGDNMMVVKKQILNLNPSYDPSEFLNPAAHNATKDHLARRNAVSATSS